MELFAGNKQNVPDIQCSKEQNSSYNFYWPAVRMAYGDMRFGELGKSRPWWP